MPTDKLFKYKARFILLLISMLAVVFGAFTYFNSNGRVLFSIVRNDDVLVTGLVQNCDLRFRSYPEKRIPRTGNWRNILRLQVREPGGGPSIMDISGIITNNLGEATVSICGQNAVLLTKNYDFYFTGESHLRKYFPSELYDNATGFVDFTTGGRVLLAGDTSVIKDEKINSLDISTQIVKLNTNDSRNDLNKDTEVNSLDISNTIYNFYKLGD